MAIKVREHHFRSAGEGRTAGQSKYPWRTWFNGQTWMLEQGKDFPCSPSGVAQAIRRQAHRIGGRIFLDYSSRPGVVFVRFAPPPPTPARPVQCQRPKRGGVMLRPGDRRLRGLSPAMRSAR